MKVSLWILYSCLHLLRGDSYSGGKVAWSNLLFRRLIGLASQQQDGECPVAFSIDLEVMVSYPPTPSPSKCIDLCVCGWTSVFMQELRLADFLLTADRVESALGSYTISSFGNIIMLGKCSSLRLALHQRKLTMAMVRYQTQDRKSLSEDHVFFLMTSEVRRYLQNV